MSEKTVKNIAQVVVPIPVDKPFTYSIPEELKEMVSPGIQVIVPFGKGYQCGLVVEVCQPEVKLDFKIKPLFDVVNPQPFVGEDIIKLLKWISEYYICYLGEAFRLINLGVNLHKADFEMKLSAGIGTKKLTSKLREFASHLSTEEWLSLKYLESRLPHKNLLYRVHKLEKLGLIETRYTPPSAKSVYKTVDFFELQPIESWTSSAQKKYCEQKSAKYSRAIELIKFLQQKGISSKESLREADFTSEILRRLTGEGVLCKKEKAVARIQERNFVEENKSFILTDEQQSFIDLVAPYIGNTAQYKTFLLHGITGSGKTQIYIELVRKVTACGQQAIVLIPEIVLTPQTMARFYNYFGDKVAVLHSRITGGERLEILQKIRENRFSVVIGPRSVVFAPFTNLGIIVVDEEHEGSYKQTDAVPRYNARDVALYRASLNNIPLILGSATPNIESLFNAMNEQYQYFHLATRISSRNLPRTQLVDFKVEWGRTGAFQLFSENLLLKLETRILIKEQAMLLQNRRGFAPFIQCHDCGYVENCPNCDITLTYHIKGKNLRCHYCGYSVTAPDFCPQCKGVDILYKGIGTQKIEEEAKSIFPYARLLRMDQDTTRRKDDYAKILQKFSNGEADFLIGTKMIAKGLDFEKVTLVGIMNADQGLHFPDFRASEKTFQLLVQAAGRAGRGNYNGEVVIQTFDPNHYIFKYLLNHDYLKFYHKELETRKTLNYPPFSRLCLIRVKGESEEKVYFYAKEIAKYLWKGNSEKKFTILGPAPAPLVKIDNQYRYHILIKQSKKVDPAMSYVRQLIKLGLLKNPDLKKWPVTIQIDMDPLEIL